MTVINAKREFLRRRNLYIAELMSIFDADSSILDYDIDYSNEPDQEEHYEVVVRYNSPIDLINLEYKIVPNN